MQLGSLHCLKRLHDARSLQGLGCWWQSPHGLAKLKRPPRLIFDNFTIARRDICQKSADDQNAGAETSQGLLHNFHLF